MVDRSSLCDLCRLLVLGEHDAAIQKFERAIEIIRGSSLNLNLDEHLRVAKKHLDMSRKDKEQKDRSERRDFEKRIRSLKNLESEQSLDVVQNRASMLPCEIDPDSHRSSA